MQKRAEERRSEQTNRSGTEADTPLTRRAFGGRIVWGGVGLMGIGSGLAGLSAGLARAAHHETGAIPRTLLDESPFAYISPLRSDGSESTCHAELWYAWLDESVVVTVASDRWKASALARGLDRARIWVGAHGRWKTWYGGTNEAFRGAPHFEAGAEKVTDPAILDRLLEAYERKYPDEIADWRERMRTGNADGSRIMIRYTPLSPLST